MKIVCLHRFKCYKCEGPECFKASHPEDLVDCESECYVGLNSLGQTVRGCSQDFQVSNCSVNFENDNGLNNCTVCAQDMCNFVNFPLHGRLRCHSCVDEGCKDPQLDDMFCNLYGQNDACVTVFDNLGNPIERGCLSSLKYSQNCDGTESSCVQCSNSDLCNTNTTNNYMQCAFCNSSINPDCVLSPKIVDSKKCSKGCFTKIEGSYLISLSINTSNGIFSRWKNY